MAEEIAKLERSVCLGANGMSPLEGTPPGGKKAAAMTRAGERVSPCFSVTQVTITADSAVLRGFRRKDLSERTRRCSATVSWGVVLSVD